MQSLSNYQWHFSHNHRTRTKTILKSVVRHKRLQIVKAILRKKNRTGGVESLTSDYTTKLQLSKQDITSTKIEIQINGTGLKNTEIYGQ